MTPRDRVKSTMRRMSLLVPVRWVRTAWDFTRSPSARQFTWNAWQESRAWRRQHGDVLGAALSPGEGRRTALIVGKGTTDGAKIELGLIKGLQLAGFAPIVLADRRLARLYRLAGGVRFVYWEDFVDSNPRAEAERIVARAGAVEDLLPFEYGGARVGKFALSTTFRSLRVGRLDFSRPETRRTLAEHLAAGMMRAVAAQRLLQAVQPDLALFMGNRYTGQSELMDVAVERGVDVLTWFDAHRSSTLMLKRYTMRNRDWHHGSLSDRTWDLLRAMEWSDAHREALRSELYDNYAAGDWYSRGGTQVGKMIQPPDDIRRRLRLDPGKKTAVIFPHIVWDATLFWGTDLFPNYEDWFVETVRAACANSNVNWIIKIHPAHVAKGAMERYDGDPAELVAVRERVGPLPPHVSVIGADTDINTYSLFPLMDYCLTVRGTIGIESATFGARVLTAGTGRYDHRGFTTDSDTREEYLARVSRIETLPRLSASERELAERFAYGAFLLRPMPLTAFAIEHERDIEATTRVHVVARSAEALGNAPELKALAAWARDGRQEDFLWNPERLAPTLPGEPRTSSRHADSRGTPCVF